MNGVTGPDPTLLNSFSIRQSKPKVRPGQSCTICRKRKVKCDRVKPCRACCVRQTPSQCTYDNDGTDRYYMSQSEAIERLRKELHGLKTHLAHLNPSAALSAESQKQIPSFTLPSTSEGSPSQSPENPPSAAPPVFEVIAQSPQPVVDRTVQEIHDEKSVEEGVASNDDKPRVQAGLQRHQRSRDSKIDAGYESSHSEITRTKRNTVKSSSTRTRQRRHSSQPTTRLMANPNPRRVLFEPYVERFIDAFGAREGINSLGSHGMRAASELRAFSPLLDNAFHAAALAAFGSSSSSERNLHHVGDRLYLLVLRQLRKALADPKENTSIEVLYSVLLVLIVELYKGTSENAMFEHTAGILRLFELRGAENHMHGIAHSCFVDLRAYWVSMSLLMRWPTFLAQEDWKTIPWAAGTTEKDIMQHLLDIVVDIPSCLARHDKYRRDVAARQLSNAEMSCEGITLALWMSDIEERLHQWKRECADTYPDGGIYEETKHEGLASATEFEMQTDDKGTRTQDVKDEDEADDEFPVFRCVDLMTGIIHEPSNLTYPDVLLAESMCLYWAALLVLAASDIRNSETAIGPNARYTYASNICRSIRYYFKTVSGPLVFRIGTMIHVALDYFGESSGEGSFLKEVYVYIGKKYNSAMFLNMASEISTPISPDGPCGDMNVYHSKPQQI